MEKGGLHSAGREFKNAKEMWREQVGEDQSKKTEWYRQGVGYWESQDLRIPALIPCRKSLQRLEHIYTQEEKKQTSISP
ncbi:hypothetical protein PRUPE_4G100800 [Prunus persica]|uniref:Uncharacterized protein n=1 Tax=Prunus persica TaxID=3760 RepID=M5X660_PRUPE|nr:hypothetical protein PRUPE_4G100800 [Prunus persica]